MADKEVRFGFGKNWSSYLTLLDENRIQEAEDSIKKPITNLELWFDFC